MVHVPSEKFFVGVHQEDYCQDEDEPCLPSDQQVLSAEAVDEFTAEGAGQELAQC